MESKAERNVVIRTDQDEALEAVAPAYLKGQRKSAQRVQWALDEFLKERGASSQTLDAEHLKRGEASDA